MGAFGTLNTRAPGDGGGEDAVLEAAVERLLEICFLSESACDAVRARRVSPTI